MNTETTNNQISPQSEITTQNGTTPEVTDFHAYLYDTLYDIRDGYKYNSILDKFITPRGKVMKMSNCSSTGMFAICKHGKINQVSAYDMYAKAKNAGAPISDKYMLRNFPIHVCAYSCIKPTVSTCMSINAIKDSISSLLKERGVNVSDRSIRTTLFGILKNLGIEETEHNMFLANIDSKEFEKAYMKKMTFKEYLDLVGEVELPLPPEIMENIIPDPEEEVQEYKTEKDITDDTIAEEPNAEESTETEIVPEAEEPIEAPKSEPRIKSRSLKEKKRAKTKSLINKSIPEPKAETISDDQTTKTSDPYSRIFGDLVTQIIKDAAAEQQKPEDNAQEIDILKNRINDLEKQITDGFDALSQKLSHLADDAEAKHEEESKPQVASSEILQELNAIKNHLLIYEQNCKKTEENLKIATNVFLGKSVDPYMTAINAINVNMNKIGGEIKELRTSVFAMERKISFETDLFSETLMRKLAHMIAEEMLKC